MKKLILIAICLIMNFVFSQEKYKASDYSLTENVKTYNTFTYRYDIELGKYKVMEKRVRIFEKGLLKYDYTLNNFLGRFSELKFYEYNAQNQLISIKTANDFEASKFYPIKEFFYENNLLIRSTSFAVGKNITTYTYDKNKRLILTKTIQEDTQSTAQEVDYKYTNASNYSIYYKNYSSGKITSEITETIQNNLLVKKEIKDNLGQISYSYKYDDKGNEILFNDGLDNYDTNYLYSKTGAVLKSRATVYDDLEDDIINYFYFSEITYQDNSKEGSKVFDKNYASSFKMSVLSYDYIDDLK